MRAEEIQLTPSRDIYRELAALREENEILRDQLTRQREKPLDLTVVAQTVVRLGVTANDARMLLAMANGRVFTREQIQDITGDNDEVSMRTVDSRVKRLRKRIPWIEIKTIYGLGYMLTPQCVDNVRRFLDGETPCTTRTRSPAMRSCAIR